MEDLIGTKSSLNDMEKGFAFVNSPGAPKPEKYFWPIYLLMIKTRERLEEGSFSGITVMWGRGKPQAVLHRTDVSCATPESKLVGLNCVRWHAASMNADFVCSAADAWSVKRECLSEIESILEKYGSIAASPFGEDIISFTLETHKGVWHATVPVEAKHTAASGKTFRHVTFRYAEHCVGHLAQLLPAKSRAK